MKTKTPTGQIFKPAMAAALAIAIMCGFSIRPAQAGYIVTLQEVGSNVVATGSGAIDLTGLTFFGTGGGFSAELYPLNGTILTGAPPLSGVSLYSPLFGPESFGNGGATPASSGAGDLVGLVNFDTLGVPAGYVSDTPLSDSAIYDSATFSSLGVNPGTYEWTWGNGPNQNFTLEIGVPDSGSTLSLLAVSALGLVGVRKMVKA